MYACRCKRLSENSLWVGMLFVDWRQVQVGQRVRLKETLKSNPIEIIIPEFRNSGTVKAVFSRVTLEVL